MAAPQFNQAQIHRVFSQYWSSRLGVTESELETASACISTSGRFLSKQKRAQVYLFENLQNSKKILVGPQKWINRHSHLTFEWLESQPTNTLLETDILSFNKPTFDDFDFCPTDETINLANQPSTSEIENGASILEINKTDHSSVTNFLSECSIEDQDTLDLNLSEDQAWGIFINEDLQGICRTIEIPETIQLTDLTLLVVPSARGQGLATVLARHAITQLLQHRKIPKYRVSVSNSASISIAKRLGLNQAYRIIAWDID